MLGSETSANTIIKLINAYTLFTQFTYLHAQYQSFTAHLEHYEELKEQNRKIDQMIAESAEYIKCSNGDALNKFIMDEYDKMCSSINELSGTSAECTKAAKYSVKDS